MIGLMAWTRSLGPDWEWDAKKRAWCWSKSVYLWKGLTIADLYTVASYIPQDGTGVWSSHSPAPLAPNPLLRALVLDAHERLAAEPK